MTDSDGRLGEDARTFQPGDRVYRYWESFGGERPSSDLQPLTVVRVNRKTVTVRTDHGAQFRMNPNDIAGRYVDEDDWFVVDHDKDDAVVRGPFATAQVAAALRRELERHPPYDETGNLWVTQFGRTGD